MNFYTCNVNRKRLQYLKAIYSRLDLSSFRSSLRSQPLHCNLKYIYTFVLSRPTVLNGLYRPVLTLVLGLNVPFFYNSTNMFVCNPLGTYFFFWNLPPPFLHIILKKYWRLAKLVSLKQGYIFWVEQ